MTRTTVAREMPIETREESISSLKATTGLCPVDALLTSHSRAMRRYYIPIVGCLLLVGCGSRGDEGSDTPGGPAGTQNVREGEASAAPAAVQPADVPPQPSESGGATYRPPELLSRPSHDWLRFPGGHVPGPAGLYAARIDASGKVVEARVVRAGHPRVDELAVEALRSWRFKPATKDGVAVESEYTVTININLE